MSILNSNSTGNSNMNTPSFHDFKKQASFFFKEKIKTARLALTDVTPAQLLAEEATNGNPGGPDARSLKMLSKAAFEVDDYWRIVEILHKRLVRFDRRNWRVSYKVLIVLEYLLTHGPESVAEEFQSDRDVIKEMENFQHIDEKGFNWGLNVRKKCERILKLLQKGTLYKEERDKARKISRGIEGFGSFSYRNSSTKEEVEESTPKPFDRCNSQFNDQTNQDDLFSIPNENNTIETNTEKLTLLPTVIPEKENSKENLIPDEGWNFTEESNSLLGEKENRSKINTSMEDVNNHPFDDSENVAALSLLSTGADKLQVY